MRMVREDINKVNGISERENGYTPIRPSSSAHCNIPAIELIIHIRIIYPGASIEAKTEWEWKTSVSSDGELTERSALLFSFLCAYEPQMCARPCMRERNSQYQ